MTIAAIIVAAGRGTRAAGDIPKQWQLLAGHRVVDWTLAAFLDVPEVQHVVLVLHPDDIHFYSSRDYVSIVIGGDTRTQSVCNGLSSLIGKSVDKVLIHDVARPCVTSAHISEITSALNDNIAVAPALKVTDALWLGQNDFVTGTQDRSGLYRAQTPQGFDFQTILDAHQTHIGDAADDAEIALSAGVDVKILEGDEKNLKITGPDDFARAEKILRGQMDIRIGTGFDVHRFGPGDYVILCGVAIPHNRGLQGHSDADVGMHALTDAIYGALAKGDIGQHFPPSDPQWEGAESHIFLRHAVQLAAQSGYKIGNMDVTFLCEFPKIGPHAQKMRLTLADITAVDQNRISVKATTTERLGFTGREEGIAAQAAVTLVSV